ncbi:hypothetical protein LTR09_001478 [Extremus antarcticus]|uniref:Pentatricopeptide repeat-containing protein n=1 Tax=Extremus antarcticus TaxID=702011 RepID=A0AAJ0GGT8_9PEZI|nr:hypothetical protein LTR09_001478 [Extremus antarcticus]
MQDSLDTRLPQVHGGEYPSEGTATARERQDRPSGRYSSRALRPQELLDQLDTTPPPQASPRPHPRQRADNSSSINAEPARPPRGPSVSKQEDLPPSIWKFRRTLIRASTTEEGSPLDKEVWPSLVHAVQNSQDRAQVNKLDDDIIFRSALRTWSLRVCEAWLLQLPILLRGTAKAEAGSRPGLEPTALQALRICALFDAGFKSKARKALWFISRDLWECRNADNREQGPSSALEHEVTHELMGIWNLCMTNQSRRHDSGGLSKHEYMLGQIASTWPVSWECLSQLGESPSMLQQGLSDELKSSIGHAISVLAGVTGRPPPTSDMPYFSGQRHYDSASAAVITLGLLQDVKEAPGEVQNVAQFEPWMNMVAGIIQKVAERRCPHAIAERIANAPTQRIANSYGAVLERFRLLTASTKEQQAGRQWKAAATAPKKGLPPLANRLEEDSALSFSEEQKPPALRKDASRTDRFTYLSITRLGRANEQQDLQNAERVLRDVRDFSKRHTDLQLPLQLYEHLIMSFLTLRNPKLAIECWNDLLQAGHQPTTKTYTIGMRYSLRLKGSKAMQYFWTHMKQSKVQPDTQAWTARIYGLFNRGRVDAGLQALGEMGQEWLAAARNAYLRDTPGQNKSSKKAPVDTALLIDRFTGDIGAVPRPTAYTMNSAMTGLSMNKDELIPKVLTWGRSFGIEPDVISYNTLINVSMRNGKPAEAMDLLRRMRSKDIEADGDTWNVLFSAIFESGAIEGLEPEQQEEKVMQLIKSLEDANAAPIDQNGYSIVIDRLTQYYKNPQAVQTVLAHMVSRGVEPTSFHYTILMASYFDKSPPDLAAVETLWNRIKTGKTGHGTALTPPFFNRMIEGYAVNHNSVGPSPMLSFLSQMESQGKRPSWRALECVARALAERGEWDRLAQIADTVRRRLRESGVGGTTAGQHEGITDPNQLMRDNMGRPMEVGV